MNEFEKQINELRLQFKAEQRQISKDIYRTINRLNTAIGHTNIIEAREALRAERLRVHEAMCRSHEMNRKCYLQQLELLNDQYRMHLEQHPPKRAARRAMEVLRRYAQDRSLNNVILDFGENHHGEITFD